MTTSQVVLRVNPYGDAGLLVEFDGGDRESRWQAARDLGAFLRAAPPQGVMDVVASFTSVFVAFDPLSSDTASLTELVQSTPSAAGGTGPSRLFTLPVVYGGTCGLDLELVARDLGLTCDEVIQMHTSMPWTVRFIGSPAGAPLMEGPSLPANVPRLSTPRTRVDQGAVGLSGMQSIIYNAPSPGGWKLIGRTPLRLFDLDTPPHVPYQPGDQLRFVRIEPGAWDFWVDRHIAELAPK